MRITRREFHQRIARASGVVGLTGIAAQVAGCSGAASESSDGPSPIVDTHQHLWDLKLFQPPWLKGAPEILSQSYTTREYLMATQGLNVVKAVYMEIDVAPAQQLKEAEHVIELSRSADHPTVAAVISGRPAAKKFVAYIARFKGSPYIKGVRQVLQVDETRPGHCLEPQFVKSMQLLGELGMSFDLCMRPRELQDGAKLARLCPDTRFIVDHCGNADPKAFRKTGSRGGQKPWHDADGWRRDIADLASLKNVVCKISGIIARAPQDDWTANDLAPIIEFCLESFGPDRVMFGSDWPVCNIVASLADWVTALKQVISNRSEAEQRKLLHDNAVAFYSLA